MNSSFQRKHDPPKSYEGRYSTDVLTEKAYSFLEEAVDASDEKPFFLTIAPVAPHANIVMKGSALDPDHVFEFSAPISAERHQHLFADQTVPRTENFNPDFVSQPKTSFPGSFAHTDTFSAQLYSPRGLIGSRSFRNRMRQMWTTMIISSVSGCEHFRV